jgi:hypothetical protein
MNVATVANNATGTSPFIAVEFDRDGNLATSSAGDRRPIAGRYEFEIDLETFQTTMVFTPSELYPSAGTNPASPRLIVMTVPQQVVDLTNKPVLTATGGGVRAAIPETRSQRRELGRVRRRRVGPCAGPHRWLGSPGRDRRRRERGPRALDGLASVPAHDRPGHAPGRRPRQRGDG